MSSPPPQKSPEHTDLRQCPQPDLHVKKLEGHASDPVGRPVRSGEIVLLDAARKQVAHASNDSGGNFSFPGPLVGAFDLRIDGGGLNPVDRNRRCIRSDLQRRLGEIASCLESSCAAPFERLVPNAPTSYRLQP